MAANNEQMPNAPMAAVEIAKTLGTAYIIAAVAVPVVVFAGLAVFFLAAKVGRTVQP